MIKKTVLFFLIIINACAFGQGFDYLPSSTTNNIIKHTYYTLSYSAKDKQAEWVAYMLTKSDLLNAKAIRKDNFRPDSLVTVGSASLADYEGSGYDRGHLVPVGDMKLNFKSMNETFFLSNISPQLPEFNQRIWEKLEEQVRDWAKEYDTLYIATGGTLKYSDTTIGVNKVTVPKYFYKIIYCNTKNEKKAIGFVLPNAIGTKMLSEYAVSIDSVEKMTGIDFLPFLPDSTENRLENKINFKNWTFTQFTNESDKFLGVQCKGVTNDGDRCKKFTKNENGYCEQHQKQVGIVDMSVPKENRRTVAVRCSGIWDNGSQCTRMTYSPIGKCWQHGGD
jgi:endonuclease G, mitochondrial